jgi:IS5 family transposase
LVKEASPRKSRRLTILGRCRGFVGIDLGREPVPDETTVCRFRHRLETHDLGQQLFAQVQRHLAANGPRIATGTIVEG